MTYNEICNALAEAEIEYADDKCTSIFVKFKVQDDKGKLAGIDLNRKMLAEIAVSDKDAFAAIAEQAKAALAK